jgi:hypothetical protein
MAARLIERAPWMPAPELEELARRYPTGDLHEIARAELARRDGGGDDAASPSPAVSASSTRALRRCPECRLVSTLPYCPACLVITLPLDPRDAAPPA